MARPLLVACDHRFVEDVLDHLGGDVDVDVTLSPTPQQWQAAPVVLLDARSRSTVDRLPARRNVVVIVGSTATPTQVADLYRGWLEARSPATVYQWPYGTETVRRVIAGATAAAAVPRVRVGVIGGHGGAGASTLAVALAQAACYAGRRTVLVDGDPLGGGIGARLGGGLEDPALLRIVSHAEVRARFGGLVDVVSRTPEEVLIADLSRALDEGRLAAATRCDVVLVVAHAAHNAAATRRVLAALSAARAPVAVVGRSDADHTADHLAADHIAPRAGDMPLEERAVDPTGSLDLLPGGALFAFAAQLLAELPELIAEAVR